MRLNEIYVLSRFAIAMRLRGVRWWSVLLKLIIVAAAFHAFAGHSLLGHQWDFLWLSVAAVAVLCWFVVWLAGQVWCMREVAAQTSAAFKKVLHEDSLLDCILPAKRIGDGETV